MPRGSKLKTRNRKRDIDQIYEDSKPENTSKKVQEATVLDEDKPALGQYYCLPCDKYFCDGSTLEVHKKQKPHKRRLKALEEKPHSQDVADWAAGVGPAKRKRHSIEENMETIELPSAPVNDEPKYVAVD